MRIAWLTVAIVIVGAAPAGARPQLDAKQGLTDSACQALQSLPLASGHVDSATPVQAMPFTMEIQPGSTLSLDQPPHCRMMATLTPTRESDIRIEVWLPEREWNGKLLGIGNVNWCGGVNALQMAVGLREHYVVVGTNRGHTGCSADSTFIARPAKLQEFGYLAVHEMTKIAKGTILAYYGKKPAHSYFLGGSSGGGQALMEAQRYPDDYDGIVASAPTIEWTHLMAANLWNAQVASVLSRDSLTALHDAVMRNVIQWIRSVSSTIHGTVILILRRCCALSPMLRRDV